MVIKNYSVTLDQEDVSKAKDLIKSAGGKLSPILSSLLKEWIKKQEEESDGSSE